MIDTLLPAWVLRPTFACRHQQLAVTWPPSPTPGAMWPDLLTIAVTGAGRLAGTALTALLTTSGHHVTRLVRRPPRRGGERCWRPDEPGPELLEGVDAVILLAWAPIGGPPTFWPAG